MSEQYPSRSPSSTEEQQGIDVSTSRRVARRVQIPDPSGRLISNAEWDARRQENTSEHQQWRDKFNADKAAERDRRTALIAEDAALIESLPPALVEATNERYGPGAALALAKGELSIEELSERPAFTHAGTGEQLGLADVKARLASAAEKDPSTIGPRIQSETQHIGDDFRELLAVGSDVVRSDTVETDNGTGLIEAVQLDDTHTVEVARGLSGEITDVTVYASELGPDGSVEEHTVEVIPDNAVSDTEIPHPEVKIDGEVVETDAEIETASAVLSQTGEELDAIVKGTPSEAKVNVDDATNETPHDEPKHETAEPAQAEQHPPKLTPEQQERNDKLQFIGHTLRYLNTVPEKILQQVSQEAGIDLTEFREQLSSGQIKIDRESVEALQQLQRNGLQPNSPEWHTDPRNPSMVGGVVKESRQLLVNLLRQTKL